MRINAFITTTLLALSLFSHCIFPERKDAGISENSLSGLAGDSITENKDNFDFSKVEISKDSLDLKLYYLIDSHGNMSNEMLIKNIENLVSRGADPNAMVEVTYSVRKLGTYIPIIREFYNHKYNEYTTITTPMHAAVACKKVPVVEKLILLGGKTDLINKDKIYPIEIALVNNQEEMVDCLVKHGCKTANINLSKSQNTDLIERLVKLGADPKTIDINYALEDKSELKRLLVLKAPVDNTLLDMSVVMKDNELFNLLIENGMTPNIKGKFPDECPIIFSAVKYGNMEALKKLIQKGANINSNCRHGFGETPLQTAIHYQKIEMIKYLLDLKANPNEKDWTGKSVLMLACNTDNDLIINLLIDRGADIEYHGYFGGTALIYAVQMERYISAEKLIKRKANINFTSTYGETALIKAIGNNDLAMIKMLIENGANPKIKYEKMNLVQYAQDKDVSPAVLEYLKQFE